MGIAKAQLYEIAEAKRHSHVAQQLGITEEFLDNHTFTIDDSRGFPWLVVWDEKAPEGVEVSDGQSAINPYYEPELDGPEDL